MDFIIDRTVEDVMYAQSLIGAIWNKMSNAQKEEWLKGLSTPLESLKGFFNYTDMIRIKNNYNTLVDMYNYTGDLITTSYAMDTIPNRTTMSADFEKVRPFANAKLPYFLEASFSDYRTPSTMSSDVNRIDYNFLNDYEHLLKNLYDYIENGCLDVECEYKIEDNRYTLDGYLSVTKEESLPTSTEAIIKTKVPSGYIAKIQSGSYSNDTFTPYETIISTDGEEVSIKLGTRNQTQFLQYYLEVESGIQEVSGDGRDNRNIDNLTSFSSITFDNEPIEIEYPYTTYTATEVQSDFISTNDKEYIWFCNASNTSGRIIVTFYDENEDTLDEYAIKEDSLLMCNGASYFTIDSEVGDSVKYARQTDLTQTWNGFGIANDTSTYLGAIHSGVTFNISQYDSFHISRSDTSINNNAVILGTVSIENGQKISDLDTEDIEVKYTPPVIRTIIPVNIEQGKIVNEPPDYHNNNTNYVRCQNLWGTNVAGKKIGVEVVFDDDETHNVRVNSMFLTDNGAHAFQYDEVIPNNSWYQTGEVEGAFQTIQVPATLSDGEPPNFYWCDITSSNPTELQNIKEINIYDIS